MWLNLPVAITRVYDATFSYNRGSSPVFDTNSTAMFFLSGSHLKRRDRSGLTVMARRLPADTLFWVGEKFGLVCCCNKQTLERMFVFDVNDPVIKHKVYLPAIQADLIEVGCFFSDALCWFFVSVKEQEKVTNQCAVINREGQLTAVSKADAGDGSWLGSVHGKCAIGKSLLSTSEEGIVSVCCKGTAIHPQTFPQTKQFITQDCDLLPGAGGVYVVNKQNITFLQIT